MAYKATCYLIAVFVVSLPVTAAEIYRWYDADGQLHFGDQPRGIAAETVQGLPRGTGDKDTIERMEAQQKFVRSQREHRLEERAKTVAAKQERQKQANKCRDARIRLVRIQQARFLYTNSENGERQIMNDEERSNSERKATAEVERLCS